MSDVLEILVRSVVMVASIILFTRLQGLRSFSKLSGFDFSLTVAFGSILAGTVIAPNTPLIYGVAGLASIFLVQVIIAYFRRRYSSIEAALDNNPLLLMEGTRMLEANMARAHISEGDLLAKLREANVLSMDQVHAVVLETTGDISVLHSGESADLDVMLDGVTR